MVGSCSCPFILNSFKNSLAFFSNIMSVLKGFRKRARPIYLKDVSKITNSTYLFSVLLGIIYEWLKVWNEKPSTTIHLLQSPKKNPKPKHDNYFLWNCSIVFLTFLKSSMYGYAIYVRGNWFSWVKFYYVLTYFFIKVFYLERFFNCRIPTKGHKFIIEKNLKTWL